MMQLQRGRVPDAPAVGGGWRGVWASAVVLLALAGCLRHVAPVISQGEIPIRNEIARVWQAFAAEIAEGRIAAAWDRLSDRCRRDKFRDDPEEFRRWVAAERQGLLRGLEEAWLFRLRVYAGGGAKAQPEGMDRLREVRFRHQAGLWRLDDWTPVEDS